MAWLHSYTCLLVKSRWLLMVLVSLFGFLPSFAYCDGREQEGGRGSSPSKGVVADSSWYDAESNSLLPIHVHTNKDDSIHRGSRWLPTADPVQNSSNPATYSTTSGSSWLDNSLNLTNWVAWLILAIVVVGTGVTVAWVLGKGSVGSSILSRKSSNALTADERLLERVQHLPEELRRENLDYRSETEKLMESGKFDQAIILLLAYQLLLLDRAACLRLSRGKTNRQYLREMRVADATGEEWFARVINLFESSYFGRIEIFESDFRRCWQENAMLEGRLANRLEANG